MHAARLIRTATVLFALATSLTLTGCSAAVVVPPGTSKPTTASANSISAPLDCNRLLPVELAATALGLPASTLFDPATQASADTQPSFNATNGVMSAAAIHDGGLLRCSFSAPDNGTGAQADDGSHRPPNVAVSVLPNAAAEFAQVEPDSDDGLGGFAPANLGDTAFIACHPPESDSCRAEILVGTTWISTTVTPRPDEAAFTAFAETVVAAAHAADPVSPLLTPKKIECDSLLGPADLADTVGIPNAQSDDYLRFPSRSAGIVTVSQARAGLVSCSWLTSDSSTDTNSIGVMILPGGKKAWDLALPDKANSSIRFEPLAGIGDAAFAGCDANSCEVNVRSGEVWLSVNNYASPTPNLDGTKALAKTVLASYSQLTR
jgi:hypothetical protein